MHVAGTNRLRAVPARLLVAAISHLRGVFPVIEVINVNSHTLYLSNRSAAANRSLGTKTPRRGAELVRRLNEPMVGPRMTRPCSFGVVVSVVALFEKRLDDIADPFIKQAVVCVFGIAVASLLNMLADDILNRPAERHGGVLNGPK